MDAQGIAGRRSTRLNLSVSIVVSGKDTYGQPFRENSRATVLNKHGAKILTFHHLSLGSELTIENRAVAETAQATVVWLGERKFPKDLGEAGVQLGAPGNVWGVDVPPEDWQEGAVSPEAESPDALAAIAAQRKPPAEPQAEGAAPPEEAQMSSDQIGAAMDVALDRFTKRAQEAAELQAQLFEARVAKLTNQIGTRLQASVEAAATGAEEQMNQALEKHLGTLTERVQSTRGEIESLMGTLQEVQRKSADEVEKAQRNIQEAGAQALQSASQELAGRVRSESDSAAAKFVEETQKRLHDESSAAIESLRQNAQTSLSKLSADFAAESEPKLLARQNQAVEDAANRVGQSAQSTATGAIENLQKKSEDLGKDFEAQLEKSAHHSREKSAKEIAEHIHKVGSTEAENLLASSARELHKHGHEASAAAREDLKATLKDLAEDAKKKLTALTHHTVESLNKEGNAGVDEFRKHLHQTLKDFQEKGGKELEKHFEAAAQNNREQLAKQLQKDSAAAAEQVLAKFRADAEEYSKAAVQAAQQQVAESVRRSGEELAGQLHGEMQKEATAFQEQTLADTHSKLQSATEQQLAEVAARMDKQEQESLATITQHMNDQKEKMVGEADEAFRAKMAEAFSSMLQPGSKKNT